jgi:DNA invertase Pin-like site-specific DNA recombinase
LRCARERAGQDVSHPSNQDLTGQLAALKAAGATTIYREKVSGVRAERPQLAKLMASLKAGDVVVVTKLDRLGRSTRELLELIDRISKAGASFRSLGDPLWDTGSPQGRLLSTLLAAIAEFERSASALARAVSAPRPTA